MSAPRRLLLVDDHPLFRSGLRQALAGQSDFEIVAEAATVAEAMAIAREAVFDVAVVDISLPDGSGLDLVAWLKGHSPNLPVLVMSMHSSVEFVRGAFRKGASGYLTKGSPASEFSDALHTVSDGGAYAGAEVAQLFLDAGVDSDPHASPLAKLTAREREVANHLAHGSTAAEVADELGISVKTVEAHRGNMYRKLGIRNVVELTRLITPGFGA